ncbi:MAG: DUF3750 domain-containing protein [Rhodospirillales bacterium]
MAWRRRLVLVLAILAGGGGGVAADWRTASREPIGIAPDPAATREAVVQVYAARAWGWRGRFAVHTWIAVKPTDAAAFTVYEVIGWRAYHGLPALAVHRRPPDGRWFGAAPEILFDLRGAGVDGVIGRIDAVARAYPFADTYRVWPGPNSNTFTAHVVREVPELVVDLPPTAIGKDYLTSGVVARAPSGTGVQMSVFGLVGLIVGRREGLEINLLGLVFGLDPDELAIKLPIVGRIGLGGR